MIDLIGDIHGHADKLEELLLKLGYKKVTELIRILTGKYYLLATTFDRGPKIRETLLHC